MRRFILQWSWCTAALMIAFGCGKSHTPSDTVAAPAHSERTSGTVNPSGHNHSSPSHPSDLADPHQSAQPEKTPPRVDPADALRPDAAPETVVTAFLEATRRGDDSLATQLLSKKALEETARVGLAVKPPGTPQMRYAIEKVEYPKDIPDGVYVHSVWTEPGEQGDESFDVIWVLRKQPEGWRIVGMAAHFSDDETPYFLNFEQPDDLYRKMQQAAGEDPHQRPSQGASSSGNSAAETANPTGTSETARLPSAPPLR